MLIYQKIKELIDYLNLKIKILRSNRNKSIYINLFYISKHFQLRHYCFTGSCHASSYILQIVRNVAPAR